MAEETKKPLVQPAKEMPVFEKPLYYVGIGASAGGLEALQDLFKYMPRDTGMAFVVIQHLSPDYRSMMDELLARHTAMTIHIAEDGMPVTPNTIYLIPPRKNLMLFHGKLYLEEQRSQKALNLPIDVFLRSLAADQGKQAIAVILSGTGSDGTLGIRAVKEAGGIIVVQDEQSAKFDGMPRSSISTGLVDFILPPAQMGEALLNYVKHPFISNSKTLEKALPENMDTLAKINLILRDYIGIDFSYYKENTIARRLERRVSINRCHNLEEYLSFLMESDKEKNTLYREMLIGVTRFFRDGEAFDSLKENVLPHLNCQKGHLRIWSAGCSTGEEVYSLAMICLEEMEKRRLTCELKIFATDIDRNSLNTASQGLYSESIVADIDQEMLAKYFIRLENGYQVKENLRKTVVFATHNLLKDPPFSRLDLMVCRNLFIYLKPEMQQKILNMFYYSLKPGGFLFMGNSETLGDMSEGFKTIDGKWKIYQYREGFRPPLMRDVQPLQPIQAASVRQQLPSGSTRADAETLRQSRLLENALEAYLPPSVIVDQQDRMVQVINDMNPFFQVRAGQFSDSILKHLPNDLSLYVSGLLRRLKQGQEHLVYENIEHIPGFEDRQVAVEGRRLELDQVHYYLISFREMPVAGDPVVRSGSHPDVGQEMSQRVKELENELQISRENLQATVEELETSNEELQSSNEELIASNEELQSTNEELQSVNEELYTVNSEFQSKIDELTQANNDLTNLLHNTEVGAIYLDRNLCIRRITPVVKKITNLRESDVGRPISHIAAIETHSALMDDVNQVLENLQPIDREIVDENGGAWFVRTRPYRTSYHAVEGVLVTFVEISRLKHLEAEVHSCNYLLETVLDHSPVAKTMVDASGDLIYVNQKAETVFGLTREQLMNRTYDDSQWKITDLNGKPIPPEKLPFAQMKQTLQPVSGYQHYVDIPGKGKQLLTIYGVPVIRHNGVFEGGVFTIENEKAE
ncbi:chemotaxis protein CheB [Anoxynatronum buryatiense]|uniref:chemotaxis protein CheB n=1 Tax=Anoxynatronum buryatiense TaxID=489973 RepID=UPI0024B83B48|nr:chemotaxis protein CheB [Anoxynatronum buryatiense]